MAVTITEANLIYPQGDLQNALFPDGDLSVNLSAWLSEAKTKTSGNDAARHWVYYRAYTAISLRIAALPTREDSHGDRMTEWSQGRVESFQSMAQQNLDRFNQLAEQEQGASALRTARFAVH